MGLHPTPCAIATGCSCDYMDIAKKNEVAELNRFFCNLY
jgi:hypothetical protein